MVCAVGEARQAFIAFALFGKRAEAHVKGKDVVMDGRAFAKLAKEAGLLDGKLDATRVDLTFAKCADKVREGQQPYSVVGYLQPLGACSR